MKSEEKINIPHLRVLVVEDDPINTMVMKRYLGNHFEVTAVSTGPDALQKFDEMGFPLVLLDINLGSDDMDGLDVYRLLSQKTSPLPIVIAVTAYVADEDRRHILAQGIDGFCPKPVTKAMLLAEIQRCWAQRRRL